MREEGSNTGLLTGEAGGNAAVGPDPLDAVMAVSMPREELANASGRSPGRDGDNVVVETRVSLEADAGRVGDDSAAGDGNGYGEFAWPDGYAADPEAMARFVPMARKLGLSKAAAQELAGLYAELDQGRSRAQAEFIAKNNAEWIREIREHPEFGGGNLQRAGESVASMMRRYGSPLLMAQIRQMNVQNWPEMFYFLARVSQAVSEDCSPSGSGGAAAAKSTAQLLFPGLK